MTLFDLGVFGFGLQSDSTRVAILRTRPSSPAGAVLPPEGRAIGLGEELPPDVLMRFGLSDPRNYDSVELARSLAWFDPI